MRDIHLPSAFFVQEEGQESTTEILTPPDVDGHVSPHGLYRMLKALHKRGKLKKDTCVCFYEGMPNDKPFNYPQQYTGMINGVTLDSDGTLNFECTHDTGSE